MGKDENEAAYRKSQVGNAPSGSRAYFENAKHVLESYTNPNAETRSKLSDLEKNGY